MVSRMPPTSPAGDEVDVELVEDLRVLAAARRRTWSLLDVVLDARGAPCLNDLFVGLAREDVEALHERQAGVDHRRELAREDHDVPGLDRPPKPGIVSCRSSPCPSP